MDRPSAESSDLHAGPARVALLALGFRPFFLLAQAAAIPLPILWVLAYRGDLAFDTYYGVMLWHAHEMLFGYAAAVIAGFLLTSVRSWTQRETLAGPGLAALILLWLAGRLLPLLQHGVPAWLIAAVDFAFLPALGVAIAIPLVRQAAPRNMVFVPVLTVLAIANALVHLGRLGAGLTTARAGVYLGVDIVVLLVAIVGGRVLPFFTERSLPGASPARRSWLEGVAIGSLVVLAGARLLAAPPWLLGSVAALAAVAHALRLAGWYHRGIGSVPLLWVLHLGYGWLVLGLALTALSPLLARYAPAALGGIAPLLALHALTAGAIGVTTLGMMARVALGHTGRPLRAAAPTVVAFALVNLAAAVRVLGPLVAPGAYPDLVVASALLWSLGFGLVLAVYARILVGPRADGRPG